MAARQHDTTRAHRPASRRVAALTAVAAAGLAMTALSGCSFVSGDSQAKPPAAAPDAGAALDGEQRTFGPIQVVAASYWGQASTKGDDTHVSVAGCGEGQPCPGFDIVTGQAAADGSSGTAYLPAGSTCPGGDALEAVPAQGAEVTSAPVTIGGKQGTRTAITLDCQTKGGKVAYPATQIQWYVPETPAGPVLIVDRWSMDGLDARLAAATWVG